MAPQWQFEQDERERWRWTCVESTGQPINSAASFESRMFCVLDAMRYAMDLRRSQPQPAADGSSTQTH